VNAMEMENGGEESEEGKRERKREIGF